VDLLTAWLELCSRVRAYEGTSGAREAGGALLDAYGASARAYHDTRHLAEVLDRVDELALAPGPGTADLDAVRLAAWFHDAVYDSRAPAGNEERSAAMAVSMLSEAGVDPALVAEISRLVLLTAHHDPEPGDASGALLCDADLAVLARDPAGYAAYAAAVRQEYAHVPDEAFRSGRSAILRELLEAPALFRTQAARSRWEATARANVAAELRSLQTSWSS
jgi:predicted metal-dependent HD superfamily phosphohydrolase